MGTALLPRVPLAWRRICLANLQRAWADHPAAFHRRRGLPPGRRGPLAPAVPELANRPYTRSLAPRESLHRARGRVSAHAPRYTPARVRPTSPVPMAPVPTARDLVDSACEEGRMRLTCACLACWPGERRGMLKVPAGVSSGTSGELSALATRPRARCGSDSAGVSPCKFDLPAAAGRRFVGAVTSAKSKLFTTPSNLKVPSGSLWATAWSAASRCMA